MTCNIDLHVHTKYSGDTNAEPEEAVVHGIKANLQGIVFTEHYSYEASWHAGALAEKYRDRIMVLRGVEFSAAEGHCLVFGVNTDLLSIKNAPVKDLVRIVSEQGGVVIPSHPFRGNNSVGNLVRDLAGICALEGYNGYSHYSMNRQAVSAAEDRSLPYTGGSDAHIPSEVGACYTAFQGTVTPQNFIDMLKAGNYTGVDTRKVSKVWPF